MSATKPIPCRICGADPEPATTDTTNGWGCVTRGCVMWERIPLLAIEDWNQINAPGEDERRMDYMEESESRCKMKVEAFVVTSMDDLMHYGSTYREAIDKAMKHDGWKGTE